MKKALKFIWFMHPLLIGGGYLILLFLWNNDNVSGFTLAMGTLLTFFILFLGTPGVMKPDREGASLLLVVKPFISKIIEWVKGCFSKTN